MIDAIYPITENLYDYVNYYGQTFVDIGSMDDFEFLSRMSHRDHMDNMNDMYLSENLKALEKRAIINEAMFVPLYNSSFRNIVMRDYVKGAEYLELYGVFDYKNCRIEEGSGRSYE